jgi:DNA-binding CsgD family transcriptional regulator
LLRRLLGLAKGLTEKEKAILQLKKESGLSDYKIARRLKVTPETVTRSRLNAQEKLRRAKMDLEFAKKFGVDVS